MKPPGRCIFCHGFGLSKEHLFSDWLRELFPRAADDTHSVGEKDETPWRLTQHQGHSGTKKFRSVCKKCNNEWMSGVDDAAKQVAVPLIRGEHSTVTRDIQRALALWFAKTAVIADYRKPKRSLVPQAQRAHLMNNKEPPAEWEIWIASYEGTDYRDLALHHNSGRLDFTPVRGPGEQFKGYVATTFVGMGKLAALVIADDLPMIDFNIGTLAQIARRVWPVSDSFDWPLPHGLNDGEAAAVATIIEAMQSNFRDGR